MGKWILYHSNNLEDFHVYKYVDMSMLSHNLSLNDVTQWWLSLWPIEKALAFAVIPKMYTGCRWRWITVDDVVQIACLWRCYGGVAKLPTANRLASHRRHLISGNQWGHTVAWLQRRNYMVALRVKRQQHFTTLYFYICTSSKMVSCS